MLEFGLDFVVAITFQEMGGESKKYPKIPRPLEKKIGYIRFAAKLPDAAPWQERLIEMADGIAGLRHLRHTITHGVALAALSADKAKVTQMRYTKLAHYTEDYEISADDLDAFARAIADVLAPQTNLIIDLIQDFKRKNADKPIGKRLSTLLG